MTPPADRTGSDPDSVLDRLLRAIETGDIDAARATYHPGARIWHNFDQTEQTVDENLATLAWFVRALPDRRYEDVVRHPIDGGVIQQHVVRGTTRTGAPVEIPAVLVAHVEGGLVVRIEEYLDPAQAGPLRAG